MPKKVVKSLNTNVPSYKQKLQFESEFKKSKEREKIKPKEIFESKKRMSLKKRNINISIVIGCRRDFLLEDVIIQEIIDQ